MDLPIQLWRDPTDGQLVRQAAGLFDTAPLVITDRLTNSVFFNGAAERLFGVPAEEIVNRAAYSLLGFGEREKMPDNLAAALLGSGSPWRGVTRVGEAGATTPVFCEASAVVRSNEFVCGLLRFSSDGA